VQPCVVFAGTAMQRITEHVRYRSASPKSYVTDRLLQHFAQGSRIVTYAVLQDLFAGGLPAVRPMHTHA
jgi:hypothetical protein